MAFHEVLLPTTISVGAVGSWAGFNTAMAEKDSGHEKRNINWEVARGEWDVVHGVRDQNQLDALLAFFANRAGKAHSFRFQDPNDLEMDRQSIGTTDTTTANFQVFKRYTSLNNYDRNLFKMVAGAELVWVDDVPITEGAGASQYQLNDNTGLLTLGSTLVAQSGTDIEMSLSDFHVPVRFDIDRMTVTVIRQELYDWPVPVKEVRDIV